MKRLLLLALGVLALGTAVAARGMISSGSRTTPSDAQTPVQTPTPTPTPSPTPTPGSQPDEGIPITNEKVKTVCGDCHKTDDKGRMSRISFRRTTPEGWQETIRRMVTLNKAEIEPADAREIVKYLADNLGLAPEETKPAYFETERRLIDFKYTANSDTESICSSCHSMGRVMLQRRTGKEWDLVLAMHRGWYPLVDTQVFRRFGPPSSEPGPDGRPPDNRHPMDKALAHLKPTFPFTTPEWTSWSASMRSPRLEGTWLLSGYDPGAGPIFGTVKITSNSAAADEFTTETTYQYSRSGRTVTRSGRSVIYAAHQWRGRTTVGGDNATSLREVMEVERDWQSMAGRWFNGDYDELGPDVKLARIGAAPIVAGLDRPSARRGGTAQTLRIYGANFPSGIAARDVDFGRGVSVSRVVNATPTMVTVEVDVASDAVVGARDLFLAGVLNRGALTVYDKIDFIKIKPGWNMARVGGVVFPKMVAQFEAFAFAFGPDGKADTKDDLQIGPVDAAWTVEEYTATFDDDDVKFVGEVNPSTGLFTPALDGPNEKRSGNRNNVGDVWVIASHQPPGGAAPMRARAHLVVTVPLYLRWDFSTVNR
jgi:quinohemoprotein amine dehydrogenase